jgi:predicted RNA polymerase sigma factor
LREARAEFEIPARDGLEPRLESVLEVIYLIFNEGYSATAGEDWVRPALCDEALRLGRILAELVPAEGEVHGLAALMELQASRLRARTGPDGQPVLLDAQDRARWDPLLIRRGLAALERAGAGRYGLQAEIAACHARATSSEATDWRRITALYERLLALSPSPVIALNHAVAAAMAFGPEVGLALAEPLRDDPALARYHLLPSVRGDLLARLGRADEASAEFKRAASLTANTRERELLQARAAACVSRR